MLPNIEQNDFQSRGAAAPPPARPASRVSTRSRAVGALLVGVALLGSLGSFAWRHRVDPSGPVPIPFRIAERAWRSVLTAAVTADRACPASGPLVVLYVSASCPHCIAELQRWSTLIRTQAAPLGCIGITIVAAPNRANASRAWLPGDFESALVWDHDHDIAKTLEVRLVPLAVFVTGNGLVISKTVGEASNEETARRLGELRRVSGPTQGDPPND